MRTSREDHFILSLVALAERRGGTSLAFFSKVGSSCFRKQRDAASLSPFQCSPAGAVSTLQNGKVYLKPTEKPEKLL